ncbi:hypothetical protein [Longitalea luteola]|uniref:hypothetical protein n=1 Tax=Longitalea luteola TaxID=2812563 RepID=UPI001A969B5C|nr:hypothetical protein [Longitalea luteola]
MKVKEMATSAAEMVGSRVVAKGANKAIQSLPMQKQNKIRGALMIGAAMFMLVSGLKMLKRRG